MYPIAKIPVASVFLPKTLKYILDNPTFNELKLLEDEKYEIDPMYNQFSLLNERLKFFTDFVRINTTHFKAWSII